MRINNIILDKYYHNKYMLKIVMKKNPITLFSFFNLSAGSLFSRYFTVTEDHYLYKNLCLYTANHLNSAVSLITFEYILLK